MTRAILAEKSITSDASLLTAFQALMKTKQPVSQLRQRIIRPLWPDGSATASNLSSNSQSWLPRNTSGTNNTTGSSTHRRYFPHSLHSDSSLLISQLYVNEPGRLGPFNGIWSYCHSCLFVSRLAKAIKPTSVKVKSFHTKHVPPAFRGPYKVSILPSSTKASNANAADV